jgi:hypothetical protein
MHIFNGWKKIAACLVALLLLACCAAWWGYAHLTGLVQARLRLFAGNDLSIARVTTRWNSVELEQVRLARHGAGPFDRSIAIGRVVLRPRLVSLFSGRLVGDITLEKPCLLLEIAPDGSFVRPFPAAAPLSPGKAVERGPTLPVTIDAIHVSDGSIELLDWHAGRKGGVGLSNPHERYHLLHFDDVSLDTGKLEFPPVDRRTSVRLGLKSRGGGVLTLQGELSPASRDSHLRLDIKGLNITRYRPYFLKPGDLGVSGGTLTAGCDINIEKRRLKAPGSIVLKDLKFEQNGVKGVLMGIPAWALIKLSSDSKGELRVVFALNGSLDNPRFVIRQSLREQIVTGLSARIGIPTVSSVGKGIVDIGEKGVKGLVGIFGGN